MKRSQRTFFTSIIFHSSLSRPNIQLGLLVVFFLNLSTCFALNRVIDLWPGQSFEDAAEALQPGDTLVIHAGTYSGLGRISLDVQGTAAQPVVIRAAESEARPLITRPAHQKIQNTINLEGVAYLTIQGLEITGNGGDGIRVNGTPSHHVVLEDLLIHNIDVGINTKNNSHDFIIRDNHIYDTGINGGTGEGLYIGCHDGSCSFSDSVIENNLIHDALPGTRQGDGIEVKVNSENILIRDNVIYNRPFPGIFVYGGGAENIVEGNVVWNCPEGIAAISDAIVRNNILFDNKIGLNSFHHVAVPNFNNTSLINNTLYNNKTGALLRWKNAANMVLANNAIYSPGQIAVDSCTTQHPVVANVTIGRIKDFNGCSTDANRFISGRSAEEDFTDVSRHDFWPGSSSALLAKGDPSWQADDDFNHSSRLQSSEVGAYAYDGRVFNPGWPISATFKTSVPVDNPRLPTEVDPGLLASVEINHNWKPIEMGSFHNGAVVITAPPSFHGAQPSTVRLRKSTAGGFDMRIQEWEYLDGVHASEIVPYMVLEKGRHIMSDGSTWEVGSFDLEGTGQWKHQRFLQGFSGIPRLFLTVQTENGKQAVSVRARNVTQNGFEAALFEQEQLMDGHKLEVVGYLVIDGASHSGSLKLGGETLAYQLQQPVVSDQWQTVLSSALKVEEEQSADLETVHKGENIDVLSLGPYLFAQDVSSRGKNTIALRQNP